MLRDRASRLAVIIPAYRPSIQLIDVLRSLSAKSFPAIIVVDDGSGPEFSGIFDAASQVPGVQLLRHATNLGKGAALKTAINHALCNMPGLAGVVTADADGQHDPDDIEHVAERLLENPGSLVLGCRQFHRDVPLRSRIGNIATSAIMHALMGRKMSDTQTGLRGIPASLATRILKIEATGYEFELEMLLAAHHISMPLVEEPIRTIYEEGNRSSHFNPIVDSMKIYFVLLRFGSVSFLSAVLDNLVFYLAFRQWGHVLGAQILGRVFGISFNYTMVRTSVFYSHERHKKVLPKYLMLALGSGAVSYAGIRLLASRAGVQPVAAKLIVETILFFVNFAVQRLFIFTPGQAETGGTDAEDPFRDRFVSSVNPAPQPPDRPSLTSPLLLLLLLATIAVEAYGFYAGRLFTQEIWEPIGLRRFTKFIGMFLALAGPALLMVPWTFPLLMASLVTVGTAFAIGPLPLLAVVFFLISSCALGARLLRLRDETGLESQLFSTMLGIAAWILVMTATARIPVNSTASWAVFLALPIALDLRGTRDRLHGLFTTLRDASLSGIGERIAFALLVFFLLASWFVALMPETSADGLAMHLAIPANIAMNHRLTFEPNRFLWAVMPMAADFTYTIQYLLAGEYAAHLIDFVMLLLIEAMLYCVLRRWLSRAASFLLLALFATTPLVYLVTGSLFVENVLAAFVFAFMAAIWRFSETGQRRYIFLAAVAGGTALATKFGALAFIALGLPFALWEIARHRAKYRAVPVYLLFIALLLGTALPPYAIAWHKTQGNPLFPFVNDKLHSPLLPPNPGLVDYRFLRPLNWSTLFDLTFRSHLTYEGQDGSFGFQYFLLIPAAALAVLLVRRRAAISAATVALGAAILIMSTQPNARYLYPALPLFYIPFAALWGRPPGLPGFLRYSLAAALTAFILINAYFLPSSSYYHRDFCLRLPFSRAERDRFRAAAVPVREVVAYYNKAHPDSTVLLADDAALAELRGTVYENHWHQYDTMMAIRRTLTVPDMVKLMQGWGIQYFIAPKPASAAEIKPQTLAEMLMRCTEPEFEIGDQYLSHFQPTCRPEPPAITVSRGWYDDFDPALIYRGNWNKDTGFAEPDHHTISYSETAGSEIQITFEGTALTYNYTKAPNRGIADISIDGIAQPPLDLYSAEIHWQSQTRLCCFPAGKHVAIIRVSGRRNPQSTGQFVDLDSFSVE